MPQTSEKQKLVNFIIEEAASNILLHLDDDNSYWKIMDELDESLTIILSNHRGNFQNVPKCLEWRTNVLDYLDEGRYQQMLRVSRDQFALLLSLIKDSAQFNNAQSIRQFSVEMQLAITLYRLGSSGESAAIRKVATLFGVGDGETLYKITKRVFSSILELKSRYITWPDTNERQNIVKTTYNELPHCIGYIDGTELKLAEAPVVNHSAYFSKSRIYSIKAQVVCDYQLRIRHVVAGHFGSVHDARMFRTSALSTQEGSLFSSSQWLAGDSAYPLLTTLITPFRTNSQQMDYSKRKTFNLRHSRYRVRIEHCFGILKERFGSLKELRTRIQDEQSHILCSNWIIVCCILHNIFRATSNDIEYVDNIVVDNDEESDEFPSHENGRRIAEAKAKRISLYTIMFGDQ